MADEFDFSHALRAELFMEDFNFNLVTVEYGLNRNADERGMPTDAPKRMMIKAKIFIEKGEDSKVRLLYDWALNSDKKMDGAIVFMEMEGPLMVRLVDFEGGICVGFREYFQNDQINVLRETQTVFIPDNEKYYPRYRGEEYFMHRRTTTGYDLTISADKMTIASAEIPS